MVSIVELMVAVELTGDPGSQLSKRERWRIRRAPVAQARVFREVVNVLVHAVVVWVALVVLVHPRYVNHSRLLRIGGGIALLYGAVEIIASVITLLFAAAGYSLPVLHRHPIAARSVGEFWGRRWNIVVSAWLQTYFFRPAARRNQIAPGIMLAFFVSGVLHGWLVLFGVGVGAAGSQFVFFMIQGVVVLVENQLRIHAWPVAAARVWTLAILFGSSPLFIEPGLRLFEL